MKRQMNSDGKKLFLSASTEIRISPCAYSEYITEKLTASAERKYNMISLSPLILKLKAMTVFISMLPPTRISLLSTVRISQHLSV